MNHNNGVNRGFKPRSGQTKGY